jgi:alginate O-acetyltransferase complex protein AlgI
MVFSSVMFLFIFLPWTLIIHYFLPARLRNTFLLLVSLLFYAWGEGYLTLLILGSILINYLGGLLIGHFKEKNIRLSKILLGLFIALNILVLVYFKYFHFLLENLNRLGLFKGTENPYIHLPIGISFYTFHIMSYLIDVYRRDATPQKNPLDLGLYIFLFPQLVAGPIIRYKDISNKIAKRFIIGEDFTKGVIRFVRGLAKKVIIANSVALLADKVFAMQPHEIPTALAWLAIVSYTLQIYFDFSGYSDMAIGLGQMMGFTFPENFNYPYIATSIQEFWQRWHISLSTWFRDYLYIPLGGNKAGKFNTYRNLFIVFFVTGLWHGSSWNFIVWGLFHGCFLVIERLGFKKILEKTPVFFRHAYTLFVVLIGWVFFRAPNFKYSLKYLKVMAGGGSSYDYSAMNHLDWYAVCIFILAIVFSTRLRSGLENFADNRLLNGSPTLKNGGIIVKYLCYLLVFIYCTTELAQSSYNPFIYFRF